MKMYLDICLEHVKYNPYTRQVSHPKFTAVTNKKLFDFYITVYEKLPVKAALTYATLTKNKPLKEKLKMYKSVMEKLDGMTKIFDYFLNSQWIYEHKMSDIIW